MSDISGLVVSSTQLSDHDVLLNVLCEEGIVSIKAKGILKATSKNANYCQLGSYSYFHCLERINSKFHLLKNAECIQYFHTIQEDLITQSVSSCLLEVFKLGYFELEEAICYMKLLNEKHNPYCIYSLFLCECIKKCGIPLVVDGCVNCDSTSKICGLSFDSGGFVCVDCFREESDLKLTVSTLKDIRCCMHASISRFELLEENTNIDFEICHIIWTFLNHYGEFGIRSHKFLEKLQALEA